MLRIVDRVLASGVVEFEYSVIPGVTSVQALAAAHRIPLNRVASRSTSPGPRIAGGLPPGWTAPSSCWTAASRRRARRAFLSVFWGAYLSTAAEC